MNADRHLLFGLLALQHEFIDKRQLVAAFGAWIADRDKSLDEILVGQQALKPQVRDMLTLLVDQHVANRGGDVAASLRSISSAGPVRDELARLADNEIQASVAKLKPIEFVTVPPSVGQSTSAGQRFVIRRPLGGGGMGIVSVAVDKELNREVALKEIRGDRADDQAYRTKFVLEAEVTGGLEHPGIVPVYGLGSGPDGRPYYAMRLIKGDNLLDHIKRFHNRVAAGKLAFDGPSLDPEAEDAIKNPVATLRGLLRRFLDICQAIHYAHDRGVLHRDLKPGNVMLGKYGETLVVDWGLAKPLGAQQRESTAPDLDTETPLVPSGSGDGLTVQGSCVGTPAYAPPEQLCGKLDQVNERSDVYGLGAILYELLTGRPPGQGDTRQAILNAVIAGDIVPPKMVQPQVPKPLEAICLRAIARQPQARYASAAELGQEIERWLDDLPVQAYPEPLKVRAHRWVRAHRTLVTTAGAMILTAGVGLGILSHQWLLLGQERQAKKVVERLKIQVEVERDLETRLKSARSIHLAYLLNRVNDADGARTLVQNVPPSLRAWEWELVHRLSHPTLRTVGEPFQFQSARFLGSGNYCITIGFDKFTVWETHTGEKNLEVKAPDGTRFAVAAVSPDGKRIATADSDVTMWDAETGALIFTTEDHASAIRQVAFDPTGSRIVSVGSRDDGNVSTTRDTARVWDAATGRLIASLDDHEHTADFEPVFSPNGSMLVTSTSSYGGDGGQVVWDVGSARPITKLNNNDATVYAVAFSPAGDLIVTAGDDNDATIWNIETQQVALKLEGHWDTIRSARFSPSGDKLVTASDDNTVRIWRTWEDKLVGQSIVRLDLEYEALDAFFTPDENHVLSLTLDNEIDYWERTFGDDGNAWRHLHTIADQEHGITKVEISNDNRNLLTKGGDGRFRILDAQAVEGMFRLRKQLEDPLPTITKNGEHIIAKSYKGIEIRSLKSQLVSTLIEDVPQYAVSSDGSKIVVWGGSRVEVWDTAMGQRLAELNADLAWADSILFSPDGSHLLASGEGRGVRVHDAATGREILQIKDHPGNTYQASYNVAGNRIITADQDDYFRIWDAHSGALIRAISRSSVGISALSPDGRWVVYCNSDNIDSQIWEVDAADDGVRLDSKVGKVMETSFHSKLPYVLLPTGNIVRIWDLVNRKSLQVLEGHSAPVYAAAYSPDGSRIVTGGADSNIKVWDTATGTQLISLKCNDVVWDVCFSPNGLQVLAYTRDSTVTVYDATPTLQSLPK